MTIPANPPNQKLRKLYRRGVEIQTNGIESRQMMPATLQDFASRQGWNRARLGRELGISQDRLRRLLEGSVKIPRSIALACAALAYGLPPMGENT